MSNKVLQMIVRQFGLERLLSIVATRSDRPSWILETLTSETNLVLITGGAST